MELDNAVVTELVVGGPRPEIGDGDGRRGRTRGGGRVRRVAGNRAAGSATVGLTRSRSDSGLPDGFSPSLHQSSPTELPQPAFGVRRVTVSTRAPTESRRMSICVLSLTPPSCWRAWSSPCFSSSPPCPGSTRSIRRGSATPPRAAASMAYVGGGLLAVGVAFATFMAYKSDAAVPRLVRPVRLRRHPAPPTPHRPVPAAAARRRACSGRRAGRSRSRPTAKRAASRCSGSSCSAPTRSSGCRSPSRTSRSATTTR